jgi:hypothetical protein
LIELRPRSASVSEIFSLLCYSEVESYGFTRRPGAFAGDVFVFRERCVAGTVRKAFLSALFFVLSTLFV